MILEGKRLVITGVRMLLSRGEQGHPENNVMVRLARRVLPVAPGRDTEHFFAKVDGSRRVTPLFLALVAVEFTDLIFAVDSIPAVLAVSQDPFIVFTSNIFAILGLRSLYFLLAGVVHRFRYLKVGLVLVLVFVGVKMTIVDVFKIPVGVSLAVVGLLITGAGFHHDRYQRGADGRWRIACIRYVRTYEAMISLEDLPTFKLISGASAAYADAAVR